LRASAGHEIGSDSGASVRATEPAAARQIIALSEDQLRADLSLKKSGRGVKRFYDHRGTG